MVNLTKEFEDMYAKDPNTINTEIYRPNYYGEKDSIYEVFNVLEAWKLDEDFYLGNVIKYIVRAGKKTNTKKEDLQKALVYLQRRINKL
jgi:hypothetical protein